MTTNLPGSPREISMSAVVIRADGSRQDLGVISYWHASPWRRLLFTIKRKIGLL